MGSPGSQHAVIAEALDVGFGSSVVVPQIAVSVGYGQALALFGTNGSGKSTFLKTVAGLLPPLGGFIQVLGTRPGAAPKRVAYLSQFHKSGHILPLRVRDVVRTGRYAHVGLLRKMTSEDEDIVDAAMKTMRISDIARSPVRELSGGQHQRTHLAQVLAHRADLLLLDEPNAGLDAGSRDVLAEALEAERRRGVAIITATHDFSEAFRCDQVMLLARRVVNLGPPKEVLSSVAILETFGLDAHHLQEPSETL